MSLHPPLALIARLIHVGSRGARAGLRAGLRSVTDDNSLPEGAVTGCEGKIKVGLAKGEAVCIGTWKEWA